MEQHYGLQLEPIAEENLLEEAMEPVNQIPWEGVVDAMRAIKHAGVGHAAMFGIGYSPIFVVIG